MQSKVTVQPAVEPLSLSEAKLWLKVENSVDDDLITSLIIAARQMVEDYTGLKLIEQTVEETFDCFPPATMHNEYGAIKLSQSPLRSVTSIEYQADAGTYTTLSTSSYSVHAYQKPPIVTPDYNGYWPDAIKFPEAVKVTYKVGVSGDADGVPSLFKNAMKKLIAQWYDNRGDKVRKMPTDVEWMLDINRLIYW